MALTLGAAELRCATLLNLLDFGKIIVTTVHFSPSVLLGLVFSLPVAMTGSNTHS